MEYEISLIGGTPTDEADMIELHPEILKKNGQPEFAVLPYKEFVAVRELLMDYEDLRDLRLAKSEEAGAPAMSLHEVSQRYGAANSKQG
jgi:hypothetical protein